MDGAQAGNRYLTVVLHECCNEQEGLKVSDVAFSVSLGGIAFSADLGGSSNYSNEVLEDRSGEGFHVNSTWTWVSRT